MREAVGEREQGSALHTPEFILLLSAVTSSLNTIPLYMTIPWHCLHHVWHNDVVCSGSWAPLFPPNAFLFPSFWYKDILVKSVQKNLIPEHRKSFQIFFFNFYLAFLLLRSPWTSNWSLQSAAKLQLNCCYQLQTFFLIYFICLEVMQERSAPF